LLRCGCVQSIAVVLESVRDELAHEVRVVWHEAVGHEMNDNEAVIATTVKFGSDKLDVKRGMPRVVIAEVPTPSNILRKESHVRREYVQKSN